MRCYHFNQKFKLLNYNIFHLSTECNENINQCNNFLRNIESVESGCADLEYVVFTLQFQQSLTAMKKFQGRRVVIPSRQNTNHTNLNKQNIQSENLSCGSASAFIRIRIQGVKNRPEKIKKMLQRNIFEEINVVKFSAPFLQIFGGSTSLQKTHTKSFFNNSNKCVR